MSGNSLEYHNTETLSFWYVISTPACLNPLRPLPTPRDQWLYSTNPKALPFHPPPPPPNPKTKLQEWKVFLLNDTQLILPVYNTHIGLNPLICPSPIPGAILHKPNSYPPDSPPPLPTNWNLKSGGYFFINTDPLCIQHPHRPEPPPHCAYTQTRHDRSPSMHTPKGEGGGGGEGDFFLKKTQDWSSFISFE